MDEVGHELDVALAAASARVLAERLLPSELEQQVLQVVHLVRVACVADPRAVLQVVVVPVNTPFLVTAASHCVRARILFTNCRLRLCGQLDDAASRLTAKEKQVDTRRTWRGSWRRRTPGPAAPRAAAARCTWCWRSAAPRCPTPPAPARV